MRDRWVGVYLALVFLQLPLYYWLGSGPLQFDFAMQEVEQKLIEPLDGEGEKERLEEELDRAQAILSGFSEQSSRQARIDLGRGILAWKRGENQKALQLMEDSRVLFDRYHGVNSFHSAAIDLRIAELEHLLRRYPAALTRFQRSTQIVRDYLGPEHSFALRMSFREVAALVALGRTKEAAVLADTHLDGLLKRLHQHDELFLALTAASLDSLVQRGEYRAPPAPATSWKSYFASIERPPKSALREDND